jgi:hypothetical protein
MLKRNSSAPSLMRGRPRRSTVDLLDFVDDAALYLVVADD